MTSIRAIYQDKEKLAPPRNVILRKQKPTMKLDLKTKLDLEEYKRRHKLKDLNQAVNHLILTNSKLGVRAIGDLEEYRRIHRLSDLDQAVNMLLRRNGHKP